MGEKDVVDIKCVKILSYDEFFNSHIPLLRISLEMGVEPGLMNLAMKRDAYLRYIIRWRTHVNIQRELYRAILGDEMDERVFDALIEKIDKLGLEAGL